MRLSKGLMLTAGVSFALVLAISCSHLWVTAAVLLLLLLLGLWALRSAATPERLSAALRMGGKQGLGPPRGRDGALAELERFLAREGRQGRCPRGSDPDVEAAAVARDLGACCRSFAFPTAGRGAGVATGAPEAMPIAANGQSCAEAQQTPGVPRRTV